MEMETQKIWISTKKIILFFSKILPCYLPRKLELLEASQYDVVNLHRIRSSEGRPAIYRQIRQFCRYFLVLTINLRRWNKIYWINPAILRYLRAGEEFEHEDSKCPEVHGSVVTFVKDDLWRHVLRSPTESPRLTTSWQLLGKPEIHQLDVTNRVWRRNVLLDLTESYVPSSKFSGLRSLYIIPLPWRYSRADTTQPR